MSTIISLEFFNWKKVRKKKKDYVWKSITVFKTNKIITDFNTRLSSNSSTKLFGQKLHVVCSGPSEVTGAPACKPGAALLAKAACHSGWRRASFCLIRQPFLDFDKKEAYSKITFCP